MAVIIAMMMLIFFAMTALAAGGLAFQRQAVYFAVLAVEIEILFVGSFWVALALLQKAFSSARSLYRSMSAPSLVQHGAVASIF